MRPALCHRESRLALDEPETPAAPTGIAAPTSVCAADASPDFAARIAQARRDARRDPAKAAMLLRSWMSDHD